MRSAAGWCPLGHPRPSKTGAAGAPPSRAHCSMIPPCTAVRAPAALDTAAAERDPPRPVGALSRRQLCLSMASAANGVPRCAIGAGKSSCVPRHATSNRAGARGDAGLASGQRAHGHAVENATDSARGDPRWCANARCCAWPASAPRKAAHCRRSDAPARAAARVPTVHAPQPCASVSNR